MESISTAVWSVHAVLHIVTNKATSGGDLVTCPLGGGACGTNPVFLEHSRQAEPGEAILAGIFAPCMNELETLIGSG